MAAELMPRQAVLKMSPYSPPTGARAGKLRLDFNENTVGCSPHIVEFLRQHLSADALAVYPEYDEARPELAAYFGVPPDQLLLTNGTDEAIQVLVNTFVDDGDQVLLPRPSYAMYKFYSQVAGAEVREIDYHGDDLSFPLEELLAAVTPVTRAILLANPNNPTGTAIGLAEIERILAAAPRVAVLIDEAYFEFYGVTALELMARYENLFISRTFSKAFGMAAMRMGCLFGQPANVAYMRKAQSPYSVNQLAALAARAAIRDTGFVRGYVAEVLAAREVMCQGLRRLGISYFPSQANFVLLRAGGRAIEIRDRLREMGMLVRDRSYEIAGSVRVTVGTREQVARFLRALEEVW
jgi:histidinol-phosphate aminotransferase